MKKKLYFLSINSILMFYVNTEASNIKSNINKTYRYITKDPRRLLITSTVGYFMTIEALKISIAYIIDKTDMQSIEKKIDIMIEKHQNRTDIIEKYMFNKYHNYSNILYNYKKQYDLQKKYWKELNIFNRYSTIFCPIESYCINRCKKHGKNLNDMENRIGILFIKKN